MLPHIYIYIYNYLYIYSDFLPFDTFYVHYFQINFPKYISKYIYNDFQTK